ncbi:MAG: T9SS type A sorting domain-containing protein [Bacteroidota bacterium]|nr:T9SS type A sorting domain-containing protein [Bacteroidota bacterium]MDP3145920.1 T9SS type A sorting domain-containing protein [Bacteroidota bacterium]MDP3558556.1 T9SS type A sorting domain-containing protein [Bacteroidota bacterium]
MIKKLLTIVAIGSFGFATAQNSKVANHINVAISNSQMQKATSAPGCQTLSVISPTANVSLYTASTGTSCPTGGYVFGNNCYGEQEIATYFPASYYSGVTAPSITAVSVGFYRNPISLNGTKGTVNTVGMKIYSGTIASGPTGAAITSTTATLASIVASQTGTTALFVYTFTLSSFAIPTAGFFTSVVLPTNSGDTAVVYTQTASSAPAPGNVNGAWSKDPAGWYDATSGWNLNVNHVMIPVVCGSNITTGISKNLGLSKDVRIMPNPSTGLVNLDINLANSQDISVTVTNALGQVIVNNKYNSVLNEVIALDLTNNTNGVYFVTVSNGQDKMVQRLILNK